MDKTQTFIDKAIKVHGDKYDYSKVKYINAKTKVIIICKTHGEFLQTPDGHISGRKCKQCGKEMTLTKLKSNNEEFIQKANLKHGDKYDYSKVEYIKNNIKVIIICKEHGDFLQTPGKHLSGQGCSKCSGKCKTIDTKYFIEQAKRVHQERYNYSKTRYINSKTKVVIVCKEHGEFEQTPSEHLQKQNCNKCVGGVALTANEFIDRAINKHGNKYDYSKSKYINTKENIIIICKIHGEFAQIPNNHLNGAGCTKCVDRSRCTTEQFIDNARVIHGIKYDYSKVKYIQAKNKVIIICKTHGEFKQTPSGHLSGRNCFKCAGIGQSNTQDFIEKAKLKHSNTYDYSKVEYIKSNENVIIICYKHGKFIQAAKHHMSGSGCPKCTKQYSKAQIQWLELLSKLNNIHIQHAMNEGEFTIPTTRYKADGYCKSTNTVYEFHGDYWHGNPNIFGANDMNKTCNKTHGDLYEQTLKKEQEIKDLGYNLITMWESDWNRINNNIKKIQIKFRHRFETH